MTKARRVWVWYSPDGAIIFGTANRAKAYASRIVRVQLSWQEIDNAWCAFRAEDDESDDPYIEIYPETVH